MTWQGALVERTRELDTLETALAHAADTGMAVLLEGPAGIGKSRLLEATRERATDFEVLRARDGVLEQNMAFGVVRQLLERRVTRAPGPEQRELFAGAASGAAPRRRGRGACRRGVPGRALRGSRR